MSTFTKATRKRLKARIGLSGPSGSGKTMSALKIATGLGERIAVIDSENRSSELYADEVDFDVLAAAPPYTPTRYVKGIEVAVGSGYDVLVIDTITPAWSGQGGVLDIVFSQGGRFQDWEKGSPLWQSLVDAILHCPIHIIVTTRAKTAYAVSENGKKVEKLGLAPEARAGLEYEFTIFGEISLAHRLAITKSRMKDLQDAVIDRPDAELGRQILAWLDSGEEDVETGTDHSGAVGKSPQTRSDEAAAGVADSPSPVPHVSTERDASIEAAKTADPTELGTLIDTLCKHHGKAVVLRMAKNIGVDAASVEKLKDSIWPEQLDQIASALAVTGRVPSTADGDSQPPARSRSGAQK